MRGYPTTTNNTITIDEDVAHTFFAAEFSFADVDTGDTLQSITLDTVPTAGTLRYDGNIATAGQVVTVADLAANKLVFTPALNANGLAYASFDFTVSDGSLSSVARALTIDVTAVDDTDTFVNTIPPADASNNAGQGDAGDSGQSFDVNPYPVFGVPDVFSGANSIFAPGGDSADSESEGYILSLIFETPTPASTISGVDLSEGTEPYTQPSDVAEGDEGDQDSDDAEVEVDDQPLDAADGEADDQPNNDATDGEPADGDNPIEPQSDVRLEEDIFAPYPLYAAAAHSNLDHALGGLVAVLQDDDLGDRNVNMNLEKQLEIAQQKLHGKGNEPVEV